MLADPAIGTTFAHLRATDGSFTTRDDVFVRYQHEDGQLQSGPLGVGYTVYGDHHHFGPEPSSCALAKTRPIQAMAITSSAMPRPACWSVRHWLARC